MVGAGFMGQGLTNQITNSVPGMRMAAVYNRAAGAGRARLPLSGFEDVVFASTQAAFDDASGRGAGGGRRPVPMCRSNEIDVIVDVTGSVEFGAHVILKAFPHGKLSC